MILSDKHIKYRLERGLRIEPLDNPDEQIQPASVDLRLDPECVRTIGDDRPADYWILGPGEFALASTLERVRIPDDLVGQVSGKSSLGRLGLAVHVTAGFIDPGFEGQITLELFNCSSETIRLTPSMYICQLVLTQLSSPAERPYGHPTRKSKYQGQKGTTEAR